MIFNWYKIFNLTEFLASGLVSIVVKSVLEGIGPKDVLVTRGNEVCIKYADVLLPVEFEGDNPFTRVGTDNTYGIYKDASEDVWLGVLQ